MNKTNKVQEITFSFFPSHLSSSPFFRLLPLLCFSGPGSHTQQALLPLSPLRHVPCTFCLERVKRFLPSTTGVQHDHEHQQKLSSGIYHTTPTDPSIITVPWPVYRVTSIKISLPVLVRATPRPCPAHLARSFDGLFGKAIPLPAQGSIYASRLHCRPASRHARHTSRRDDRLFFRISLYENPGF